MIGSVGDKNAAISGDGDLLRRVQLGGESRLAIAAETLTPRTGDGRDRSFTHDADAIVAAVSDVQITGGVELEVRRGKDFGFFRRAAVPREACAVGVLSGTVTDHCLNLSIGGHATDAAVAGVANVNASIGRDSHRHWQVQLSFVGRASVAAKTRLRSGKGRDRSVPINSPHDVVVGDRKSTRL